MIEPPVVNLDFEVWCEGFAATGQSGAAFCVGTVGAPTFEEACHALLGDNESYDAEKRTYWGCGLFDNETQARESFG